MSALSVLQAAGVSSSQDSNHSFDLGTQPLDDDALATLNGEDASRDNEPVNKVYGYLMQLNPKGVCRELRQNERFTVGRSVNNTLCLKEEDGVRLFRCISNVHLAIGKEGPNVVLEDLSSNGTFLNEKKIGKNQKCVLSHNDFIGLCYPTGKNFVYISAENNEANFPDQLKQQYVLSKELGRGACGTVFLASRRSDGGLVAVKRIDKGKVALMDNCTANILSEVRILRAVRHPCIIGLEDVIQSEKELFLVLELADSGELFEKIVERRRFNEKAAKFFFYQITKAVQYLHSQQVAHRDLKPENVLLCALDRDAGTRADDDFGYLIKVTDLGLSKFVDVHTHLRTYCGTPQYLAPEVMGVRCNRVSRYDFKADMWSLGVMLYILLVGRQPFTTDRVDKPLPNQVIDGDFSMNGKEWTEVSEEAQSLVKQLLTVNPRKRLSADQVLGHNWMKRDDVTQRADALMEKAAIMLKINDFQKSKESEAALARVTSNTRGELGNLNLGEAGNSNEEAPESGQVLKDQETTETAQKNDKKSNKRRLPIALSPKALCKRLKK